MGSKWEALVPYVVMSVAQLSLAGLLVILQSALGPSDGLSPVVLVVYQQLLSSLCLFLLALFMDWGRRPKLTLEVLCWTFVIGILQIPIGSIMLTTSLQYITATFQSVALNTVPVWVFILAVILRREPFRFWGLYGQVKLWGTVVSVAGATVMLVVTAPNPSQLTANGNREALVGALMVVGAVLSEAIATVMLESVAIKYQADSTLSAIITVFGTLQAAVVGAFVERDSSAWIIRWSGSLQLVVIVYSGILVNGLVYYARTWCIHKKGPVFATAFMPLLVVFSFLLQTIIGRVLPQLGSIIGALLVIGGLYLLLWAKSVDGKTPKADSVGHAHHSVDSPTKEPLLL